MYQHIPTILLFTLFLFSCDKKNKYSELSVVPIIPQPAYVESGRGVFELTKNSIIYVDTATPEWLSIAEALAEKIRPSTGFAMNISVAQQPTLSGIRLTLVNEPELATEGYHLDITEKFVTVSANTAQGAFRAIQTIRQLLPTSIELTSRQDMSWKVPAGVIRDFPSYAYRGAMLDVARHFFSVNEVKRFIDLISLYKMNYLHLHLSDDQGWRIEIKSWPNLTLHGGKTEVGGGEGGYYTQEQYKEIINYAQERYITIVPEIDMPGHINSALASYGELNGGTIVPKEGRLPIDANANKILDGKSKPTELYTGVEVGWSTLRLEKEATFRFVEDVIREISAITPGPYFHIGGDEAQVTKKEDYVQFINRFQQIVKANGKTMMGWEEIAQDEIGNNTIVQHWNLPKYAMMAVEKGSKLLMSPAKKAYLDMSYDSTSSFGLHWAAFIEVDSAYSWNPATYVDGISKENIIGIEAPLWSETISNMDEVEYLLFPRLPGYAEIGWSQETGRNWEEYKVRLGKHAPRFKAMNIDFYRSKLVPWTN
ncbi:MAG: beta-N-acetylhexosaminidase [Cytophagales bacterium]|nr:beta-N-acetylhexosaminidase [Cytophagales bacterium]MCA6368074.1 beta-N-acetylhexosaminidase [Cytophagales bacterium]MCA6370589.1 beta-N-acetylhexosaminidase [Cytophagales bacterium]MCA6375681.1 beta-N-acetylhexosaminidase [Cytophagales bacterium]MCA6384074.1 beta-N-acetylhexosaminidase [Cytophagales bacterium]